MRTISSISQGKKITFEVSSVSVVAEYGKENSKAAIWVKGQESEFIVDETHDQIMKKIRSHEISGPVTR